MDAAQRQRVLQLTSVRHRLGLHDQKSHGHRGPRLALALYDELAAGRLVKIEPNQVDGVMRELAHRPSVNLVNLDVQGAGNEHLFTRHIRDIPRSEMPQLPENAEGLAAFVRALRDRGVVAEMVDMDPRRLVMTQSQLDSAKVGQLYGYIFGTEWRDDVVTIASRESAILDGHHRTAAASAATAAGRPTPMHVLRVSMGIDELLAFAAEFSRPRETMEQML